jgi:hypothetical protein
MDSVTKHRLLRTTLAGSRWFGHAAPPPLGDTGRREDIARRVSAVMQHLTAEDYHAVLREVAYMRPWRPRRTGLAAVLDQLLHAAYATVILLPVVVWPSAAAAGFCGFVLGALREVEQYFKVDLRILMFWDRAVDVSAFTVAALLVYLLGVAG